MTFPFDSWSRKAPIFLVVDEDEFTKALRDGGWGESAIEAELENLREYKRRFRVEPDPALDLEAAADGNPLLTAVLERKRRKGQ